MSALRWLLLFDVDSTLVIPDRGHLEAVVEAAAQLHGHGADLAAVARSAPTAGKTELQIARELLNRAGVEARSAMDAAAFCARVSASYASRCPPAPADAAVPGMAAVLSALAADPKVAFGLVTGCARGVAEARLAAAGLSGYFPPGIGGFGDDAEDRNALVPIARARAAHDGREGWPRDWTLVIGDTPADVACARADQVRCVAVAFGAYSPADLRAARPHDVARDAGELHSVVRGLVDGGP